eukprot:404847_1
MPAYINNTFKPPNIPNMNINNNIQPPQLHRPQSNHLQQRNMSMPHPNMPNINRYNTVPPNIYERNSSMPHMQYQSNQIAMQYNNPISPHLPYTNQTFSPSIHSPNDHHHPSYGYIPENRGVIELGQPVISETWETGKKKESIIRPSKDTYKEPLLNDNHDIDYELDNKSQRPEKSGCCIVL